MTYGRNPGEFPGQGPRPVTCTAVEATSNRSAVPSYPERAARLTGYCHAVLRGQLSGLDTPSPSEMQRYLAEFCNGDPARYAAHILGAQA